MLLVPQSEAGLGWLATGAGFFVGTGAWLWLRDAPGTAGSGRGRADAFLHLASLCLVVYAVTLLAATMVALPLLLVLWPISPWLGGPAVVVGIALVVPRTMFALPGIVAGDDASTALDRAAAWVATAPWRSSVGTAACLVVSLGPALGVAAIGYAIHIPVIVQRLGILAALMTTGGMLAMWMATWAKVLDDRKRRKDAGFARP